MCSRRTGFHPIQSRLSCYPSGACARSKPKTLRFIEKERKKKRCNKSRPMMMLQANNFFFYYGNMNAIANEKETVTNNSIKFNHLVFMLITKELVGWPRGESSFNSDINNVCVASFSCSPKLAEVKVLTCSGWFIFFFICLVGLLFRNNMAKVGGVGGSGGEGGRD